MGVVFILGGIFTNSSNGTPSLVKEGIKYKILMVSGKLLVAIIEIYPSFIPISVSLVVPKLKDCSTISSCKS